jgi:hypothetical protein
LGQNHAVNAMATGMLPHTIAHGLKIDAMKSTVVAIALMKGQMLGLG